MENTLDQQTKEMMKKSKDLISQSKNRIEDSKVASEQLNTLTDLTRRQIKESKEKLEL